MCSCEVHTLCVVVRFISCVLLRGLRAVCYCDAKVLAGVELMRT